MRLTFADAQRNVAEIANRESYNLDVIFELLAAYGRSASAITKLRSGALNLAPDKDNEVLQRGVVYFKHVPNGNLLSVVDSLDKDPLVVRYNPRYLIATDYDQLVAKDTKKDTTLDIKLRDIDRNVDFFYGWTGDEVTSEKTEAVADRRAADKMKDLYAEIERVNQGKLADPKSTFRHDLNVFFSRLLFCFFAEDTKVFSKDEKTIFTNSIKDFTQTDGSDLDVFLSTLFDALDTDDKSNFTSPFSKFPYVNGTIFDTKKHNIAIPKFNAQARKLMLDCGNLDWSTINPDIFGSMFQSIVDEEHRANHGMHYTSVPNIMRTIEPLFLDELREEFDKYYDNPSKLNGLWSRISKIKVFDPACGSGNFLIIAYKELRKIEHGIIDRLFSDDYKRAMLSGKLESKIKLDNFYGIEIDDFAHEIAILSLYLAKHQMNIEFEQHFGKEIVLIPLKDNAKIVHGNAARLDWSEVCPNVPHEERTIETRQQTLADFEETAPQYSLKLDKRIVWDEIYLIGNPPYLGGKLQDNDQKQDAKLTLAALPKYKDLDYIAIWFYKAAFYIDKNPNAGFALVSTNSLFQGTQVPKIWPYILDRDLEIIFAFKNFKWTNSATNSAAVICSIVGVKKVGRKFDKFIEENAVRKSASNVNPYLIDAPNLIVLSRTKPLSDFPPMLAGNSTYDDGHLILSQEEYETFIAKYPELTGLIKKLAGSYEYINGVARYCFWIDTNEKLELAKRNEDMRRRFEEVREFRLDGGTTAKSVADKPHQFALTKTSDTQTLLIPRVSSDRREYFPIGLVDSNTIVLNSAYAVFDANLEIFGILTSKMHLAWTRLFSGRLKSDVRYSTGVVYNTFPIRPLLEHEKRELTASTRKVLFARENHSEKTLAEMYDPDKMPDDLREAHHELDLTVDRFYRSRPYSNDEERLADLFRLYEQMTAAEKEKTK